MGKRRSPEPGMLTAAQVADILGVDKGRVGYWVQPRPNRGRKKKRLYLKATKIKGKWCISEKDLTEFKKLLEEKGLLINGTVGKESEKSPKHDDCDPWLRLSAAIVKQTIIDYRDALKDTNWAQIRDLEKWLRSQDCEFLSMGTFDPGNLIRTMRETYL